jgi:hypothetical protein
VISGPAPLRTDTGARTATASAQPPAVTYRDSRGRAFLLRADHDYAGGPIVDRVVSTLRSLLHGDEIMRLEVYVVNSTTMPKLCGTGANACYYPDAELMVVAGYPPSNSMPLEMLVAHEYGHHLERNRSANGFRAGDMGGQNWATYEHVCEGVRAGQLDPGDQGAGYWENPGEAFAQAYAFLHYPDTVPWWWSYHEPDEGAFDAIRADVADTGGGRTVFAGPLPRARRHLAWKVSSELDGRIRARIKGPRRRGYRMLLRSSDGQIVKRSRGTGRRLRLGYQTCSDPAEEFTLELRRRGGANPLRASITRP